MRSVTASSILARIRTLSDTAGLTLRHTDAWIYSEMSASWQALRARISNAGGGMFLRQETVTLAAGPASAGSSYGGFTTSSSTVRIYAIEARVSANDIRTLEPVDLEQRTRQNTFGQLSGPPVGFFILNVDSDPVPTAGIFVGITPVPDKAYTLGIITLGQTTAITTGSDTINALDGWDDYIVWDCVIKIAARDNDMMQTAAIANAERDRAWIERIAPSCAVERVTPLKKFDMAGMRRIARAGGIPRTY